MSFSPNRALITGASSGIGAEFAHALAARGADLVLVARREERLRELAADVTREYGVAADVIATDLARPGIGEELRARTGAVDLLINNAGFGTYGPFAEEDPGEIEREIDLNVRALVSLSRAYLPGMIAGRRGGIVNLASTASFLPIPGLAVYAASKAFVRSFTEALWHEARPHGVKVLALSPGSTYTEFWDVLGTENAVVGKFQTSAEVVACALRALDSPRTPPGVVSGLANSVSSQASRFLPRRLLVDVAARLVR